MFKEITRAFEDTLSFSSETTRKCTFERLCDVLQHHLYVAKGFLSFLLSLLRPIVRIHSHLWKFTKQPKSIIEVVRISKLKYQTKLQ